MKPERHCARRWRTPAAWTGGRGVWWVGQGGGNRPDEAVEPNGLGLPLCRGGTLGLLLGIISLCANHVQIPCEGLQVALCHSRLRLLGLVLVTQLSVVGGVGRDVQVRDERPPHVGGTGGG